MGHFVFAKVVEIQKITNVKIHYFGWQDAWDCLSDFCKETTRFAKPHSVSTRIAHRITDFKSGCGYSVFVNPLALNEKKRRGWILGRIRRVDMNSGQIQVAFEKYENCEEIKPTEQLYWSHVDNQDEIKRADHERIAANINGDHNHKEKDKKNMNTGNKGSENSIDDSDDADTNNAKVSMNSLTLHIV